MTTTMALAEAGPSRRTNTITLLPSLPTHSQLQTWVQRPQSIAKCTIGDIYGMKSLIPDDVDPKMYTAREVFLFDKWPCRMMEIVAWVAGVDHKDSSMLVTLDDGDGRAVLPVNVRLKQRTTKQGKTTVHKTPRPASGLNRNHFLTARERKSQRKESAMVEFMAAETARSARATMQTYEPVDVRVGDVVRIVGRIEEWMRKKADGSVEWVRQVTVADGSGGSISIVDPDEQYKHAYEVERLYRTTYSQPFEIPPITVPSLPASPEHLYSDSIEPSSETCSIPDEDIDFKLRDPSKLHSSQLTDSTFRQYVLDYITQEIISTTQSVEDIDLELSRLLPEYRQGGSSGVRSNKGKGRAGDFEPTTRDNMQEELRALSSEASCFVGISKIRPISLVSILEVPHLMELAKLVVDNEARKEEKRRRRRIRDGQARSKDLAVERERIRKGRGRDSWRLTEDERRVKMLRLLSWVIRSAAEDGSLIQISLDSHQSTFDAPRNHRSAHRCMDDYGYLALPPELVLPIITQFMIHERTVRKSTFMRKGDPRRGHGMLLGDILGELQRWGEEGRWERVREWAVQDAIRLGVARGSLRGEGQGWWVAA